LVYKKIIKKYIGIKNADFKTIEKVVKSHLKMLRTKKQVFPLLLLFIKSVLLLTFFGELFKLYLMILKSPEISASFDTPLEIQI
jgi:hypothetical protein